jgi:hypothetical protein
MRATSKWARGLGPGNASVVVHHLRLPEMLRGTPVTVASGEPAHGLIHVTIKPVRHDFFGEQTDALIRAATLAGTRSRTASRPKWREFSAKQLIAELRSISSEVHRMTSQVERTIARLAKAG